MCRKLNRMLRDFLRPIRLKLGKWIWDRKIDRSEEFITNKKLNMNKISSILFLRYEGKIGDMVTNTLIYRELKKKYPNIRIGVVARGAAKDIIKFNPYIDEIYDYQKGKERKLTKVIESDKYDVVVDFSETLRVRHMKFINLCKAKVNIGLERDEWNLFDLSYKKDYNHHITDMFAKILNVFEIENPDLSYDIYTDKEIKNRVADEIKGIEGNIVLLNSYAASKYRSFNREKILEISKKILSDKKNVLLFIGESNKKSEIEEIIQILDSDRVFYPKLKGILDVVEIISHAKYIVTPDTSIVHIGVAKNIPMSAVYRLDTGDNNSIVWGPNSERVKQIFSKDVPKVGEEADINKFDVEEIGL